MANIKEHIDKIIYSDHNSPFQVLGLHKSQKGGTAVRAFIPDAESLWVLASNSETEMKKIHPSGLYEAQFKDRPEAFQYKLKARFHDGHEVVYHDPYSFPPQLTEYDLHLFSEGTHYKTYQKLGSHPMMIDGVSGVHFAVWAPNAGRISVVGGFNNWDGRRHPMQIRGSSGLWELFIPGLQEGDIYKYEVKTWQSVSLRTDPYGFFSEMRPNTASVVWDIEKYKWEDEDWVKRRAKKNWLESAVSFYEVHLGSWMRNAEGGFMNYRELAHKLVDYVKELGYTHIELMPLTEHPLDESWGYQTTGYFALTSRFGTPEDFMYFVDHCHKNDIGVIMDWVPAHFPKDPHGLAHFDGTFLYEHMDARLREHADWGTLIFNYGRTEVVNFLLTSALFWLDKYHIDGLRVDAVASMLYLDYSRKDGEWIANEYGGNENIAAINFIRRFNELCHKYHPGVLTIAEESTAWPMVSKPTYVGGLGFSLKWNMGWMHDMLGYISKDPIFRKFHQNSITFGLLYAFHENFVLVLSHDEVVHGKRSIIDKMPGDLWQKFANIRLLYGFMYGHPGKKMLFMGGEFGQWQEWFCGESLHWDLLVYEPHEKLKKYIGDLNRLFKNEPAMHELDFDWQGFEWIDMSDADASVVSFIRRAKDPSDYLVFVCNFTPAVRKDYRIGLPELTAYREVLNSDSELYWGSNVGNGNNGGIVMADDSPMNQWKHSVSLTLPPLGMIVLKPERH